MRLALLTILTMVAFAANSVLNRLAVAGFGTDPAAFAVLRTFSGAVVLAALVLAGRRASAVPGPRALAIGGGTLALYMAGFSLAYLTLDAGVGALILFGGVQVTMFAGAVLGGEAVTARRWLGAAVSLGGLGWLMWPSETGAGIDPAGAGLMAAAALGWGLYSLAGRGARDPLVATAANFVVAVPLVLPLLLAGRGITGGGAALAVISGAVTSGLGYALWYRVLPALGASRAAVAQLSVPVIAAAGGAVLLAEAPDLRFVLSSALVLGGIALSLSPQRSKGSSGS